MISVIYESKNFLVLSKPAGVLVHSDKKTGEKTVVDWLLKYYPEVKNVGDNPESRPGIVHRLDKDTSGILLVARNQKTFEYLKKLFQEHKIVKTYLALVHGELKPRQGTIEKPVSIKPGTTRRTVHRGKDAKYAITRYRVLKYLKYDNFPAIARKALYFSLVELMPETGRTHQLRVHLASIHHPVVGDALYGPKNNPFGLQRQFLHALSLEFTARDGSRMKIESELPEELQEIIDN